MGEKSATAALREVEKTYDGRESENGERERERKRKSRAAVVGFLI